MSHCDFAIYIKIKIKILRQNEDKMKNDENSNISPCKNIILKKNPLKETKILSDIRTLELISSFNTSQKYHLSKILI
jgi:hypothetical protein